METKDSTIGKEAIPQKSNSGEILVEVFSTFSDSNEVYLEMNTNYQNSVETEINVIGIGKNSLLTDIEVKPNNSFRAKYSLIAVGFSDTHTELLSRAIEASDVETEIYCRATDNSDKELVIDIMYRGNSDILTEIQPIGYKSIDMEIEVPPHNRMWAVYEVQQPPIIEDVINPTQDSFTRESNSFQSINYGKNSSMVVGRSTDDIWRSFVQFDLSTIDSSYVLLSSSLRFYYKGSISDDIKLEVLNADSEWKESNITNLNKPNPIDLISKNYTINRAKGYIEFQVLDIVKDWVALNKINNGFIVRLSNETKFGQATFYTRETILKPELVVSYYDSRIFSQGRSQHNVEIMVYKSGSSDVKTEIEVDSAFGFERINTEIYAHRREVPLDDIVYVEVTVSVPYVAIELIATLHVDDDINSEVSVRVPYEKTKDIEISASRPSVLTEIYVKHTNKVEIEIVPRAYRESPIDVFIQATKPCVWVDVSARLGAEHVLDTEVSVTRDYIDTEISVPLSRIDSINIEIDINSLWVSTILTEILVSKDTAKTEVTAKVGRVKDLYTEISVSRVKVETEIEIKYTNDIWVEIEPNIKSDVVTEITSTTPNVWASITVQGYGHSEYETVIDAKSVSQVKSEVYVKYKDTIDTEIDAKAVSQVDAIVISSVPKVNVSIVIPTWIELDILTTVEPRIELVQNIYTVIQVGSKGGAYAFIM